ncbi:hypothetical protein CLV84_2399 [Neolewinella xylanilytica]|uniref:Uncharacterized protein n=1 Tax=Neolewinella xylanilytica TaxID=1514080 RepID=A0A2S6I2X6_9BACT|nr:hypothetical protein [Neolewinella xylanilytica]PPK85500.1 hypothetical protein CLV84_2399 [Neolewinella xylanilytica]
MTAGLVHNRWVAGYLDAWRRYGDFSGRATFFAYLTFFVPNLAIGILLQFLEGLGGGGFFSFVVVCYALAALLPGVAVTVRLVRGVFGRG